MKLKPKMGIVFTSIEGVDVEQEKLLDFKQKFMAILNAAGIENVIIDFTVSNEDSAVKANRILAQSKLDLICIVAAIWTPDTTIIRMIENLKAPLIVFTTTLSAYTIGVNGAQLISASLKELELEYRFIFGNIEDKETISKIYNYAVACALVNKISSLRIGVIGGRLSIMTNLTVDEYGLKKVFGATVVPIDFGSLENFLKVVDTGLVDDRLKSIKKTVKNISVADNVLRESVIYYQAFLDIIKSYSLDCFAINCYPFPYIKAKTCLAVSNINDLGIPAACESDVNSAILMYMLKSISGESSLNSDLIIEDRLQNSIMFSHCGCGPFSCAENAGDIRLEQHFEVKSGMAVYYPLKKPGRPATIVNLVGRENTFRMCVLSGITVPTKDLNYCGNPVTVKFKTEVGKLINILGNEGFGHHWMVSFGSFKDIFEEFCRLKSVTGVFID